VSVRLETFTTSVNVSTDALWAVVGDLWRLPEWTDVESVADVDPDPPVVGTQVETVEAGTMRRWRVVTWERRLFEITTTTERGGFSVGCRVVRDARGGSRLVLATQADTPGFAGALRGQLFTAPSLRRRMDRWAAAAMRVAATTPG